MLAAALIATAAAGTMYGIDANTSLVSIDLKSGKMTELSAEHHEELDAQELSAIDAKRKRYYTAGVNHTTNKVNLCVWSLEVQVQLY